MLHKTLAILILALSMQAVTAQNIARNGGFEKCGTDQTGAIVPEGWIVNRGLSKNNVVTVSREPDLVHGGNFSLTIENEPKGCTFLMDWQSLKIKVGDTLRFTCWATGEGKVSLGYIANDRKGKFLGTVASQIKKIPNPDGWNQLTYTYKISPWKTKAGKVTEFSVIPILYVPDTCEMNLDDYTCEHITAPEQKPTATTTAH